MKRKVKLRPSLELLEDRCVPATVQYTGGYLLVSNPTIRSGGASITINEVAANQFQVIDGSASLGTYTEAGTIFIRGSNANDSITFNVSSFTFAGNLIVIDGNGSDSVNVNASGGEISGNVTVLTGYGKGFVGLNDNSTGSMTIGGTTSVISLGGSSAGVAANAPGDNTVRFGNSSAASEFLGNVDVTNFNAIRVGPASATGVTQADVFGGNFSASVGQNQSIDFEQDPLGNGTTPITIGGNLTVTGGSGNVGVLTGDMNILGNLAVNLSGSLNSVTGSNNLSLSATGVTTISGNLYYTAGGNNILDISGAVIQGSVITNLGNGADSIALDNVGGTVSTEIYGNLDVTKGNGSLDTQPTFYLGAASVATPTPGIQAAIGGNVNFNVANANSTITFAAGGLGVGGNINVNAGNGTDSVYFGNNQGYDVNVLLGNGNDTVTVANSAFLSGSIVGGSGANVFQQSPTATLEPYFELKNFS